MGTWYESAALALASGVVGFVVSLLPRAAIVVIYAITFTAAMREWVAG